MPNEPTIYDILNWYSNPEREDGTTSQGQTYFDSYLYELLKESENVPEGEGEELTSYYQEFDPETGEYVKKSQTGFTIEDVFAGEDLVLLSDMDKEEQYAFIREKIKKLTGEKGDFDPESTYSWIDPYMEYQDVEGTTQLVEMGGFDPEGDESSYYKDFTYGSEGEGGEGILNVLARMKEGRGAMISPDQWGLGTKLESAETDVESTSKALLESYIPSERASRYKTLTEGGGIEESELAESEYLSSVFGGHRQYGRDVRDIYKQYGEDFFGRLSDFIADLG